MIISHRYKFIFIKTHKTAGSSMEMALAPLCGPEDIVTPMESNWDTGLPRNFHADNWLSHAYSNYHILRKFLHRHSPLLGAWYYEHMPATRVRQLLGDDIWNGYHKFCFERNPWAKVVSYYNWKKYGQGRRLPSFRDYVLNKTHRLPLDARLYFNGEKCMMDEVLDFKNVRESFTALCSRLDIPFDGDMPREKANITENPVDYRSYYDEESKAKIANEFRREIDLMGYEFDPDAQ